MHLGQSRHFPGEAFLAEQLMTDENRHRLKWEKAQRRFIKGKTESLSALLWYLQNTLALTTAAREGPGAGAWPHRLVDRALLGITQFSAVTD